MAHKTEVEFDRLFVFELANNHMGEVEHGIKVIREMKKASEGFPFRFAFKLQYRQLDTFIHPEYKGRTDLKYIKRFSETRLSEADLKRLKDEITKQGFVSICTPFDEPSVDLIEKHGFDIIKVASCSFTDWPLLERIVKTDKPIIASSAAAPVEDIDKVVAFFQHRNKKFAIMHCIGEYPTRDENLQLNQIRLLRKRYSNVPIGFSTHEPPGTLDSVKIAIGEGASIFEKHVGLKTAKYDVNAYSATPEQVKTWLGAAKSAYDMCGVSEGRPKAGEKEVSDLRGLRRGTFASARIAKGDLLDNGNTFLAIPISEGQVSANDVSKYVDFIAKRAISKNEPLMFKDLEVKDSREMVHSIVKRVKKLLEESRIVLPNKVDVEISHHYGIEKFDECGAVIVSVINREYCKKLILIMPGQKHPVHAHKVKEETFHLLYGDMSVVLEGKERKLKAGDMVTVERGVPHSFASENGAVFEEVSTTHIIGDSYYDDQSIMKNKKRKTQLTYWLDW